jgi:hypothetical protein
MVVLRRGSFVLLNDAHDRGGKKQEGQLCQSGASSSKAEPDDASTSGVSATSARPEGDDGGGT